MDRTKVGPLVSLELLTALDALFPLTNPRLSDAMPAIQRRAGARDVIDFLRDAYDTRLEEATKDD